MGLDNLMQGFAGALLGALVSIAIPLVAHWYATRVANRTSPNATLPQVAAEITKAFTTFEVGRFNVFTVAFREAYSHPHIDFTVAVGSTPRSENVFASSDTFVSLILPGVAAAERHEKVEVGWTRVFRHGGSSYRLTLMKVRDKLTFQLRSLGDDVAA